jgi:thioredoxin 1
MSLITDVSADTFEAEVVQSDIPVLLDFHAVWCGPCKAMEPLLKDVAREYEGDAKIVKIDIDAETALAERFAIKSVPTLILMHKGEVKEHVSGARTRGNIAALFERYMDAGE